MAYLRGSDDAPGGLQDFLDEASDMDAGVGRTGAYTLYQEFYDGLRGAKLRERARRYLEQTGVPFCENVCDLVVDVVAERLSLIGFSSTAAEASLDARGRETTSDPVAELAEEWWQANRADALQITVHTQALMKGDEFVIVEWDDTIGVPRFVRQRQHQVKVIYSEDEPDTIDYAAKTWTTTKVAAQNPAGRSVQRLNLYFPARIEKWFRLNSAGGQGGWAHWQDETDRAWPIDWTAGGEPLGVPVIHFRHRALGDGCGRSRVRAAIAYQEQLNKYAADLNDLVDNHALPQDWVTGVEGATKFDRVAGNVWHAVDKDAEFGRLEATPTSNLLDAIEGVLSRLARRSRIPMHLLTGGTPPSGESLKTAESGLVAVVKACQVEFGNAWEDAIMFGARLGSVFGDVGPLPEGLRVEAQWANPETRSDKADLEAATLKKGLGVSKHTLLRELGYDPEREQAWRATEAEEAQEAFGRMLGGSGEPE